MCYTISIPVMHRLSLYTVSLQVIRTEMSSLEIYWGCAELERGTLSNGLTDSRVRLAFRAVREFTMLEHGKPRDILR